jgi:hypothetical protein
MHNWSVWNGLIQVRACDCGGRLAVGGLLRRCMPRDDAGNPQMRIREELRPVAERTPGLLESLVAKMEVGAARVQGAPHACFLGVAVDANACVC